VKIIARMLVALTVLLGPTLAHAEGADLAPEISLEDFKKAVAEKKAFVIDANGDTMYAEGHVPGAKHFATIEKQLDKELPADKSTLVIAYCGGPMCTAWQDAAKAVKAKSYTNVRHFKGGISGWKKAGEPTEKGA
jgi:rhodanese-related sulfurtransferase